MRVFGRARARMLPVALALSASAGTAELFEPMPGRPMTGYVAVPRPDVEDDSRLGHDCFSF